MLDTTALTDFATGRIYARSLVSAAERSSGLLVLAIPSVALLAAHGRLSPRGRAALVEIPRLAPVVVEELTTDVAERAGALLARAHAQPTRDPTVAAHVALSARARAWPVVTSDPDRLLALDAALDIENLP